MRKAVGKPYDWKATIEPDGEVLGCIHQRFCTFSNGEIIYIEPYSIYAYEIKPAQVVAHVEKIKKDGKAIITRDKFEEDKDGNILKITRDGYVGILDVSEASIQEPLTVYSKYPPAKPGAL